MKEGEGKVVIQEVIDSIAASGIGEGEVDSREDIVRDMRPPV